MTHDRTVDCARLRRGWIAFLIVLGLGLGLLPAHAAEPADDAATATEKETLGERDELNPLAPQDPAPLPAHIHADDRFDFLTQARQAAVIFDGVLLEAESGLRDDLRVLTTDYHFAVNEWLQGEHTDELLSVRALGGEREDGSGMSSCESLELTPGRRYLVLLRPGFEELLVPFARVLQIDGDGTAVADEAGHLVTGIAKGRLQVQAAAAVTTLGFLPEPPAAEPTASGPPTWSSEPLPAQLEAEPHDDTPLTAAALLDLLAAELGIERRPAVDPLLADEARLPSAFQNKARWCGYIRNANNYYALLPDDDNWQWWQESATNWNTLVDNNSQGDDWLIGFYTSGGNPIRDRQPDAGDGDNNTGITTDSVMVSGGYGTWASLGDPNGINFTWYSSSTCTRIDEVDSFVPTRLGNDADQFRKSMTHELGHGLAQATNGAGGHENRYFAIMYPGTWRQPPNYSSIWYGRTDDMLGVRSMLNWTNSTFPGSWVLEQWTDMATWSQTHNGVGSPGQLVMTDLDTFTAKRGDQITIRSMHVENRGNLAATNVQLEIYLSTNTTISTADTLVWSGGWATFGAQSVWSNGQLQFTIPSGMPLGDYYVGWRVTSDQSERSTANNTAIMLQDSTASFAEQQIRVMAPDLVTQNVTVSATSLQAGQTFGISAMVRNQGNGLSSSSTLRYYRSTNSVISSADTLLGTDYVASLGGGAISFESITVKAPLVPGTYWIGGCVDAVAGESSTGNNCSTGRQITVFPVFGLSTKDGEELIPD